MRHPLLLIISFLFIQPLAAQEKTEFEKRNELPAFKKGIYLSHQDFIHNRAITMEQLIPNIDSSRVDFFFNFFKSSNIQFLENDSIKSISVKDVWAYFDGKGIYINRSTLPNEFLKRKDNSEHEFVRINIFGEISLAYFSQKYSSSFSLYSPNSTGFSITQAILIDLKDGKSYEGTKNNFEALISNDEEVFKEYKKSKEKLEIKFFLILKKYNMRHPFSFKSAVEQ